MALVASAVSARLKNKLLAFDWIADNAALTELCDAIAETVVEELQTNAIVSPAGVPPMSNSGGPVAGFGKIL